MRRITASLILLLAVTQALAFKQMDGPLVIGDRAKPASGAIFQVESTTGGFLGPRMTTVQRDAISSPAEGLMVYNTDTQQYEIYNGVAWISFAAGSGFLSDWNTSTVYAEKDVVWTNDKFYRATADHTSGVFATDLGAGLWVELSNDVNSASTPVVDNAVVRYNGTDADSIQESGVIISDLDEVTGVAALTVDNLNLDGNTLSSTLGDVVIDPTGSLNLPDLTVSQPAYIDASGNLVSQDLDPSADLGTASNGELLIGNGTGYSVSTLTGTANQVSVTNGSGSITLATPQDINTTSSPTFVGATLSGLTANQIVTTDGSSQLVSTAILGENLGGTGLDTSGVTDGQLLIGSSLDNTFDLATITGTANQVSVANGNGSITLSTPQDIATTSDVEFNTVTMAAGGSAVAPNLAFAGSSFTSGIYTNAAGQNLTITNNGTDFLKFETTRIRPYFPWQGINNGSGGTAYTDPAFSFVGSTDTGMARDSGNDSLILVNNETTYLEIADNQFSMVGSGSLLLPSGTTAERTVSPTAGALRWNETLTSAEVFDGTAWGSVGGGAGTLKIFHQQEFEAGVNASSFTCGSNLTASDETVDEIAGLRSLSITQGATPPTVGVECTGPTVTLDPKQQTKNLIEVCFNSTWTGNDNEMQFNVYDNTATADILNLPITASTTPKEHCGYFQTSGTASIRYDIEVLVQNASDELIIDDIEFRVDPLTPTDLRGKQTIVYDGFTSRDGNNFFLFGAEDTNTGDNDIIEVTSSGYTGYKFKKDAHFTVTFNYIGIAGVEAILRRYDTDALGTNLQSARDESGPTDSVASVTMSGYAKAGNVIVAIASANGNNQNETNFTITASTTKQGVVVKNVESSDVANTNTLTAQIISTSTCATGKQTPSNWLSCTTLTTNQCTCTVNSGVVSELPQLQCDSSASGEAICDSPSSLSFRALVQSAAGTVNLSAGMEITAHKRPADFVKESEKVYTVPVDTLTGNYVKAQGNTGEAIPSGSGRIPFIESVDTAGAWDGQEYTVQKNQSIVTIKGSVYFNTGSTIWFIDLYRNGTFYRRMTGSDVSGSSAQHFDYVSSVGEFVAGDILTFRQQTGTTPNLLNDSSYHYLNINERYGDRGIFLGKFGQPTCYVKETQTASTGSSTSLSAGSFVKSALNTTSGDCSFLSLSSSVMTIDAGVYDVDCKQPIYMNDSISTVFDWTARLRNTTDSTTPINAGGYSFRGSGTTTGHLDTTYMGMEGRLNLSSSKNFELQVYVNTLTSSPTAGRSVGVQEEVYGSCKITKVR